MPFELDETLLCRRTLDRYRRSWSECSGPDLAHSPRETAPNHLVVVDLYWQRLAVLGRAQNEKLPHVHPIRRPALPTARDGSVFGGPLLQDDPQIAVLWGADRRLDHVLSVWREH